MNKTKREARQGDISFHTLKELPQDIKEVEQNGTFVLARGEHTGHKHTITAPKLKIFQDAQGRYVLQVGEAATITHEEHKTITLRPGIWRQEQELERDPFLQRIREVAD